MRSSPDRDTRSTGILGPRALALAGTALAGILISGIASARDASEPFSGRQLTVRGRPLQVWSASLSPNCPAAVLDLFAISVVGDPPDEQRLLNVFPCRTGSEAPAALLEFEVDPNTVLVDTYEVEAGQGGYWIQVDQRGIRIQSLWPPGEIRRIDLQPPLPLPPSADGVSRVALVADWGGDGRPVAMLPSLDGGRLVDLLDGQQRSLGFPMIARYRTQNRNLPGPTHELMSADYRWPTLVMGRDNDDEHLDLFALTRWKIWVFRGGPEGLPAEPSRIIPVRPFQADEETRFEGTNIHYSADDLDGNGLSDLMLHRSSSRLTQGTAVTDIFLNPGEGAQPNRPADLRLKTKNSLVAIYPVDLNRDGRTELVRVSTKFGLLQLVRMLLTQRAGASIEVLGIDPEDPGRFRSSWQEDLSFRMDFGEGRIIGLYPNFEGDWNGDGLLDLMHPDGEKRIALRLGENGPKGPRFGSKVAQQKIPLLSGRTRIADLNGDGRDDLIAYDAQDKKGEIWVYYNRGTLPARRPAP